eukprot:TRINITY_DN10425_c0_g1_i1.p1 TRINITY_DN10425_c0_g1~~TRINITY_DN10425_c0_g1_i1.p1  ORF type:complete len:180 (-),score=17.58 TRINITY_DN10425_c0_g1_i1:60-599(-)
MVSFSRTTRMVLLFASLLHLCLAVTVELEAGQYLIITPPRPVTGLTYVIIPRDDSTLSAIAMSPNELSNYRNHKSYLYHPSLSVLHFQNKAEVSEYLSPEEVVLVINNENLISPVTIDYSVQYVFYTPTPSSDSWIDWRIILGICVGAAFFLSLSSYGVYRYYTRTTVAYSTVTNTISI